MRNTGEYIERHESDVKCGMFQTYENELGKDGLPAFTASAVSLTVSQSAGANHGPSGRSGERTSMPRLYVQRRNASALLLRYDWRRASFASEVVAEWKRKPSRRSCGRVAAPARDGCADSTVERLSVERSGQRTRESSWSRAVESGFGCWAAHHVATPSRTTSS